MWRKILSWVFFYVIRETYKNLSTSSQGRRRALTGYAWKEPKGLILHLTRRKIDPEYTRKLLVASGRHCLPGSTRPPPTGVTFPDLRSVNLERRSRSLADTSMLEV